MIGNAETAARLCALENENARLRAEIATLRAHAVPDDVLRTLLLLSHIPFHALVAYLSEVPNETTD